MWVIPLSRPSASIRRRALASGPVRAAAVIASITLATRSSVTPTATVARPSLTATSAGAGNYRGCSYADADDVVKALLASGETPEPPENPMSADRVRWEHIQRIYEMCNRNVSETARRLNMHRRTLQRILAKRSPK